MRPGRLGRSTPGQPAGCAAGGRHGLTPPELPAGSSGSLRRPEFAGPGLHSPACPRRLPCPSWGAGRRPRPGSWRRRRPRRRTPPCWPRPTSSSSAPLTLLAANRLDLDAAEAGGDGARPARPAAPHRRPDRRHGRRPPRGRRAARTRSARCSTGGAVPTGLRIEQRRVPLGVVAIIYENRPNVTSDAAGICLKSGNVAILRGSATALRSNLAIAEVLRDGLTKAGLPADAVLLVDDVRHEAAVELMQLTDVVDCLIPRGGPALIQSIRDHATVPVIIDGDGNCHVYVDAVGRSRHRARHRRQRQDPAPERVQRGRVARGARVGGRRVPAPGQRRAGRARASSWSATTGARARVADDGRGDRRRLRARVPRRSR